MNKSKSSRKKGKKSLCTTCTISPTSRSLGQSEASTSFVSPTFSVTDSNDIEQCFKQYEEEITMDSVRLDPQKEAVFVELMLEEKVKSPINATTLTSQQLQSISRELLSRTGALYSEDYLRGKYYRLQSDWKLYRELCENYTGVGWDPITGAILGSDQQWQHWLSKNKEYRKFRTKGLSQYNELTLLFGNSNAIGDYGRHAGMAPLDSDEERRVEEDFMGYQPFSSTAHKDYGNFEEGVSPSQKHGYSRKSGKRPLDATCSVGQSKKSRSASIDQVIDVYTKRQENLLAKTEDDVTITECMLLLKEIDVDDTLYMKAVQYFKDPANRVIYKMSTPEKRMLILSLLP